MYNNYYTCACIHVHVQQHVHVPQSPFLLPPVYYPRSDQRAHSTYSQYIYQSWIILYTQTTWACILYTQHYTCIYSVHYRVTDIFPSVSISVAVLPRVIRMATYVIPYTRISENHNSLGCEQPSCYTYNVHVHVHQYINLCITIKSALETLRTCTCIWFSTYRLLPTFYAVERHCTCSYIKMFMYMYMHIQYIVYVSMYMYIRTFFLECLHLKIQYRQLVL